MTQEDEEARRARAERLREEIEALREGQGQERAGAHAPESPREFVERRMRELAEEEEEEESQED
jgi:hypothetical protein